MRLRDDVRSLTVQLLNEIHRFIIIEKDLSYIRDPVFGISRNRVNAEFCKALIRIDGYNPVCEKIINYIVKHQYPEGFWNEIHPHYNQPSALVTSFIGDALLTAYDYYPQDKSLKRAKDYVLSNEKAPGYFLKSLSYTADHLNVDASCGAFLASYGIKFSDDKCLEAAKRAAKRICENQIDGFYPYTSDKGNYPYTLNIPCIHYQGVTIYYLSKIFNALRDDWIKDSIMDGAKWLSSVQKNNDCFDWSKSGLPFAYYLSGAYAFALSSFSFVSKWDKTYLRNVDSCLRSLRMNMRGLVLRWQTDSWITFIPSVFTTLRSALIGDYPISHRGFRFAYGMYRQAARRDYCDKVNDRTFNLLCKVLNIKTSTIEPSKNFPDMFMTSEVVDCLSYSYRDLT